MDVGLNGGIQPTIDVEVSQARETEPYQEIIKLRKCEATATIKISGLNGPKLNRLALRVGQDPLGLDPAAQFLAQPLDDIGEADPCASATSCGVCSH